MTDAAERKLIVGHTLAEAVEYAEREGIPRQARWCIGANTYRGSRGRYITADQVVWLHERATYPSDFVAAIEACIITDPSQKPGRRPSG